MKTFSILTGDYIFGTYNLSEPLSDEQASVIKDINDVHVQPDFTEIVDFYGREEYIEEALLSFGYTPV